MRGKQFGWFLSGASALGALIGMIFMSVQMGRAADFSAGRALWVGGFFLMLFVFGFCALQLAIMLNKTYQVQRNPLWWVAFLLACVLVFGIAAVGQLAFMYTREEVLVPAEVDMVLLLDASSSMAAFGYNDPRTDAACQFVDSLSEDCRLQAVSFAGTVLDSTQLLTMNAANKATLKQMISGIDAAGATDFNEPLRQAMDTLKREGRPDSKKAVVLLTDGQSELDSSVVSSYASSDVRVFTVRIGKSASSLGEQALMELATKTGGFDTNLIPGPGGSINAGDMLQAFQSAFEATSQTKVNMREDLIVYAKDGITFGQFLIRALVIMLCTVVIGFGYFGRISLPSIISSGVEGLIASVLVCLLEGAGYALCALILVLLTGTAFVFLDLRGEDHIDV